MKRGGVEKAGKIGGKGTILLHYPLFSSFRLVVSPCNHYVVSMLGLGCGRVGPAGYGKGGDVRVHI